MSKDPRYRIVADGLSLYDLEKLYRELRADWYRVNSKTEDGYYRERIDKCRRYASKLRNYIYESDEVIKIKNIRVVNSYTDLMVNFESLLYKYERALMEKHGTFKPVEYV